MNSINVLGNTIAQRIEDVGKQISHLLMHMNEVMARMNTISDNYRRIAVVFDAPLVWHDGVIVPQTFEEHQRSRKLFDTLSTATFVLSLAYLVIGCYFSITDDLYYLTIVFGIAFVIAVLWHFVIRAVSYRIFKLKPEKSEESRVRWAELSAIGCAVAGFAGALIFAIGRTTGDENGFLADHFVEALIISDGLLLTASGMAHAVADYYKWSELHCMGYESDRKQLFRFREQISKLTALLSRDLKQFSQIEESSRPPITLPEEVREVLKNHEEAASNNPAAGDENREMENTHDVPLLTTDDKEN